MDTDRGEVPSLVLAGGRPEEEVAFDRALVGFFIEAAELLGVPKSVAAIYGVCFASPVPLGFSEIQARLDISAGSISQGLRVLREIGALKIADPSLSSGLRLLPPASDRRRDYFEPDLELRKLVGRWLEQRLQKQLKSGHGRLQAISRSVPGSRNASAKVLRQRLHALQTWHAKARALMPIIKVFLKLS